MPIVIYNNYDKLFELELIKINVNCTCNFVTYLFKQFIPKSEIICPVHSYL